MPPPGGVQGDIQQQQMGGVQGQMGAPQQGGGPGLQSVGQFGSSQGFGMMPQSATPYSQALMGPTANQAWRNMQIPGGLPGPDPRIGEQQNLADQANIQQQQLMQQYGNQMQQQAVMQQNLKTQAMQKLLALFGGGGGQGVGAGLPTGAIQADPRILAGQQAQIQAQYEPIQRRMMANLAQRGLAAGTSSAATQQQGLIAGQEARDISAAYVPAMQASAQAYQPAIQAAQIAAQTQLTPQYIAGMLQRMV